LPLEDRKTNCQVTAQLVSWGNQAVLANHRDTISATRKGRTQVRLVVSALGIVVAFGLGAWGIAFLLPSSPAWVKIAAVMVWLFVLIASAFLLGNRKGNTEEERREFHHIVRNNVLYLAIALVPVTALCALAIHDVDKGIQRNIRQNWLLCTLTASFVVAFSIEQFWRLRSLWQMWGVLLAYTVLHFSIGVPALAHLDKIRYGYISLVATPELYLVSFLLYWIETRQA
jgi:membrane protein YdbS with pleckstrin-like domain